MTSRPAVLILTAVVLATAVAMAFAAFCEGFTEELNRLRREHRAQVAAAPRELVAINRRSKEILELLLQGFRDDAWKTELSQIEQRRRELEASIAASDAEPVLPALHPHMATVYREKVERLAAALAHEDEGHREAARSALRGFIDRIEIPAGDGALLVFGDLGMMLTAAAGERDGSILASVVEFGCGGSPAATSSPLLDGSVIVQFFAAFQGGVRCATHVGATMRATATAGRVT